MMHETQEATVKRLKQKHGAPVGLKRDVSGKVIGYVVVFGLAALACATPQKPPRIPTPPTSSPDRCMAIVDVVCSRVGDCSGEVVQGECIAALEAGCQDAAGITQAEMDDCILAIRRMKCTDALPDVCQGIATSAADEPTPRQGEIRCER